MGRVEGKVALITGAAQGLGLADAKMLAREGATVVMTDIQDEAGEAGAAEIREAGGKALFIHQDASSEDNWQAIIQRIRDEYGRLDPAVGPSSTCHPRPLILATRFILPTVPPRAQYAQ